MTGVRETSIDAYHEVKKELGKRQLLVLHAIRTLGCPTNLEISRVIFLPINQVTPRTNELVKMGYVVECEKRTCSISKKTVMSWRVK